MHYFYGTTTPPGKGSSSVVLTTDISRSPPHPSSSSLPDEKGAFACIACVRCRLDVVLRQRRLAAADPSLDPNVGAPLCVAAKHGRADVVEVLLDTRGIDVGATYRREDHGHCRAGRDEDDFGCTALALAARHGHVAVVRALLAFFRRSRSGSIAVNRGDARGRTPLWWACLHGHAGVVEALLAAGADPRTPDAGGCLPLEACRRLHVPTPAYAPAPADWPGRRLLEDGEIVVQEGRDVSDHRRVERLLSRARSTRTRGREVKAARIRGSE